MNKKFSKIFLGSILICIILLTIGIFYVNKEDILIEDIYGSRNELNDMTIVYQKRKGLYETDQVNITKDNVFKSKFVKEGADGFNLNKNNLQNRGLLKYITSENELCEDEENVSTISLMNTYVTYDKSEMTACIDIKNKKTEESKYYEIPIDNTIDTTGNTDYIAIPIKDNDNIYLTVLSSVYTDDEDSEESESNYKETCLTLYKINLSMEDSKIILSNSYSGEAMYTDGSIGFSKGDTSYFIINKKNEKSYKTTLFGFNIKTKEITELDLDLKDYTVSNYVLDGDKVLLSCTPDNKSNMMKTVLVDLNKNKVINTNEMDIIDEYSKSVISMSRQNGKLYLISGDDVSDEDVNTQAIYSIYVIDEKTNNILYKGRITEKNMYDIKFGILKEDEI